MATKYEKEAGLVMGTNSSSIVSKRSVERIYYSQPHFFRHVVKKPQRRSPLINRGYWLRMYAIEHSVREFLRRPSHRPKLVLNFGCGFDPLPFQFLQRESELCENAKFIDIDHHKLLLDKRDMIQQCKELSGVIPDADFQPQRGSLVVRGSQYVGIGCDLADIQGLETALRSEFDVAQFSILCLAEVSLTYMVVEAADALLGWASRLSDDVRFCLLEQYFPDGPDHPFAKTMMKHFSKLRTPLYSIQSYPSLRDQERRFTDCGWSHVKARSLWELWNDSEFLSDEQAISLDTFEAFDEWEEFAMFAAHYFMISASTRDSNQHVVLDMNGTPETQSIHLRLFPHGSPTSNGQRRFCAAVPANGNVMGLHGGLGRQTRLATSDIYSRTAVDETVGEMPPTTLAARMCHTITKLGNSGCLLVGGRSAPTTVLGDCWLRSAGEWRQVENIPLPRFRHCSMRVKLPHGGECVLVYGGKSGAGDVLGEFLVWQESRGWRVVQPVRSGPASRFGASMVSIDGQSGILCGGMNKRGHVLRDFWTWTLVEAEDGALSIELDDKTEDFRQATSLFRWLGRFGATINVTAQHVVIIGGISTDGFVPNEYETLVLDLSALHRLLAGTHKLSERPTVAPVDVSLGPRPLLVGHASHKVGDDKILIVGGGAVCFSFGTHWNEGTWLLQGASSDAGNEWSLVEPSMSSDPSIRTINGEIGQADPAPLTTVPRAKISSSQEFQTIVEVSRPVILEGLDTGPCLKLWSKEYLQRAVGHDRKIVVHESQSDHMNFQRKNFSYVTKEFGQFVEEIYAASRQYLRAISSEKPTELPANLSRDFPGIANDFQLPPELSLVSENAHSSPLRVSGPVTLWLHYDVLANVLCQVRGEKSLILYPPWDVSRLGFAPGASSSSLNVFQGSSSDRSPNSPPGTNPHEAILKPGDVLFIPPLWLHTASPTEDVSVAVNVFFRSLAVGFYAQGRDVYGNRDLQAYEKGRRDVEKIGRSFDRLPRDVARFYIDRLADELKEKTTT